MLTFDTEPTENSQNPVTSNGVYEALQDIAITTDKTLTIDGAAADAKATGDVIHNLQGLVGTPLTAATAASMTNTNKIYVYTGSETGYTNGNWYYYDGTAWVSGGVYNSIAMNMDSLPTSGSSNPVTSAGIKTALDSVDAEIGELKEKFVTLKGVLTIQGKGLFSTTGLQFDSQNHSCSDFIPVVTGKKINYKLRGTSDAVGLVNFYGTDKAFSVNVANGNGAAFDVIGTYTVAENGFIRICDRYDNNDGYFYFDELPDNEKIYREVANGNIDFLTKNAAYHFEFTFAQRILSSNGAGGSNANHHATDYIPVKTGETIYYDLTGTDATIALLYFYNASKTPVNYIALGAGQSNPVIGEYTFNMDGFIRICCRNDYLNNANVCFVKSVAYNAMQINNIKNGIGQDTVAKCRNQIENVYSLTDWKRGGTTKQHLGLLMFSDLHGDTERLENAVNVLNAVESIDAGVFLGDIEDSNQSSKMGSEYVPAFNVATKPLFATMGNHDFHHSKSISSNPYNLAESVSRYMGAMNSASVYSENGFGYYDFATYKIRLIILNQYEYPNANDGTNWTYYGSGRLYQQGQIDWLVSTLNSVPEDYTVIIAQHSTEPADTNNTIINTHYGAKNAGGIDAHATYIGSNGYMNDSVIADIISAYMSKGTLTKTYTYTQTSEGYTGISVNADFSEANGKFACLIVGHNHAQAFCTINSTIPVYVNDTSSCKYGWATGYSLFARNQNGYTEDLITVLCVDTDNEYLHFVRIGADRNFFGELYDVVSVPYGS